MAKDTVAMTIRVGRSSGWFRAQDSRASEFFADKVAEEALGSTRADRMVDAHKLQAQITKSVQSELEKAVRFAADKMIGTRSVLGHTTHFHIGRHVPGGDVGLSRSDFVIPPREFGQQSPVAWHYITSSTRLRKGSAAKPPNPNAHNFFINTGELRRYLKAHAASIVQGTGVIRFQVLRDGEYRPLTRKTTMVRLGTLRVTFLPRVYKNFLPGLHTGSLASFDPSARFEAMVIDNQDIYKKLVGPKKNGFQRPEWHRPLLQPVFTYWTLFRLPQRVSTVLDRALRNTAVGGR